MLSQKDKKVKVLVTGANGFVGKNLLVHLKEQKDIEVSTFTREDNVDLLDEKVKESDFIFHLAGVNRPKDQLEFTEGNADLTISLCESVRKSNKRIPVIYTPSIQAELDNAYGKSKVEPENHL